MTIGNDSTLSILPHTNLPAGDWFNAIDWTASKHNLGIGLPVRTKNEPGW